MQNLSDKLKNKYSMVAEWSILAVIENIMSMFKRINHVCMPNIGGVCGHLANIYQGH